MGNFLTFNKQGLENAAATENCNIYLSLRHKSHNESETTFLGISRYEGIPQNLIINLLAWVVLNMLFIVLRKNAWNYGRMAVLQKEELKWTDMLYADDVSMGSGGDDAPGVVSKAVGQTPPAVTNNATPAHSTSEADTRTEISPSNGNNNNSEKHLNEEVPLTLASSQKVGNISEIKDSGYFSWIKIVFALTDQQYRDKCGPDCVSYLSFQRHLIFLAAVITCCSMFIVLPINMHPNRTTSLGQNRGKAEIKGFAKTTIINLYDDPEGKTRYVNFLWAHVVLSIIFLLISIWVMRHYSRNLQFLEEDSTDVSHTICIIGLNKDHCHEDILRAHLLETYPGTQILEVSFAYNISKLQSLEFQRLSATSAKQYFIQAIDLDTKKHEENHKIKRPTLRPYICGVMGCCCTSKWCGKCRCENTDAIEYYTEQEKKYTEEVEKERQTSLTKPLGIAFVTFTTTDAAERIVEDYACSARLLLHTPESKYTQDLNSNQWIVKFAPVPEDIYWENLTLDFKMWYFKFITSNLLLTVIVVIFTTPVYVFTMFVGPKQEKQIESDTDKADKQLPLLVSIIIDTLPTAIVWILGVILISLVYQSDVMIGFWTKTAGNLSEMIKVFFFLNFMVIVLPALGVTSLSYFFAPEKHLSWSCIFYKDNGALFVNYVCTSALTGTAAELMRLPELFVYAMKLCFARSAAEVGAIRKSVLWDFQIGSNYAWTMLHFAIFTCFSVIFPLVTPFGLLYLVLKHFVDRYNIYFAYAPCKVEKQVHATAVNFVIMSMFMLQINLLAYVHFHIGRRSYDNSDSNAESKEKAADWDLRYLQIFSLLGFSVTAALFLGQVCFNVCADFSPIHHFKNMITDQDEVLDVGRASTVQPQPHTRRRTHGTHESNKSGSSSGKRRTKGKGEVKSTFRASAPAAIQIGISGEMRIIPVTNVPTPVATQTSGVSPREMLNAPEQATRTSMIVSSNYTGSGKPYGRYIPPLLRAEFIRLVNSQQRTHVAEQGPESSATASRSNQLEIISETRRKDK